MAPKKYGDKQQIEYAGADGGPITLEALIMARIKPPPKTDLGFHSVRPDSYRGASQRHVRWSPAQAARRPQFLVLPPSLASRACARIGRESPTR